MTGDLICLELAEEREGLAWLAGFVDGEGSIGVSRTIDRRPGRPGTPSYRGALQLTNTNRASLRRALSLMWLTERSITAVAAPTERHAICYHLNVREAAPLAVVLVRMLPYLIIKRRQAELVLEFIQHRRSIRGRGRYASFTERDRAIYLELKQLNHRGPK